MSEHMYISHAMQCFRSLFPRNSTSITSPLLRFFSPRQAHRVIQFRTMSAVKTSHLPNEDLQAGKLFDVSHIVTGGGTGIGLMIAQTLQSNGAKVCITGRRQEALDAVVRQYSKGPAASMRCPGTSPRRKNVSGSPTRWSGRS